METVEITIERRATPARARRATCARAGKVPGDPVRPETHNASIAVNAPRVREEAHAPRGIAPDRLVNADGDGGAPRADGARARDAGSPRDGPRAARRLLRGRSHRAPRRLGPFPLRRARPPAWSKGGILQPILREIEVECLPTEIPEFIEVDVTALDVHDAVHAVGADAAGRRAAVGDPTRTW